jgi:hypothetical protein
VVVRVPQGSDGDRQAEDQSHQSEDGEASHRRTSGRRSYSAAVAGALIDYAGSALVRHSTAVADRFETGAAELYGAAADLARSGSLRYHQGYTWRSALLSLIVRRRRVVNEVMSVVLFVAVEVVAIIWVAAIILGARDRVRGDEARTASVSLAEALTASPPMPLWKRLLAIPLFMVILPPTLLILFVLLAPFAVIVFAAHGFYWLRSKLFGGPMPDLGPREDLAADTPLNARSWCSRTSRSHPK